MARNRCDDQGFTAQLRLASRGELLDMGSVMVAVDSVLRRATSLQAFAIRSLKVEGRRELVFSIVGLRHVSTDRADSSVLPLLRRIVQQIEKRRWIAIPKEHWGFEGDSVYADYATVTQEEATQQLRMQAAGTADGAALATTDTPPPPQSA